MMSLLAQGLQRLGAGRPPRPRRRAISAPSQKVRPITEACASRRRWNGSSESSRAASSACTVAGSSAALAPSSSDEPPHHLLGEQRVALGALGDRRDDRSRCRRRRAAASEISSRVSASPSGSRKIVVASRRTPPQPGAALEQLVAGQADLQHRRAHPLREVLDQVEHALVGPVDVLPDQHQRALARESFDARAHGREEDFARLLGVLGARRSPVRRAPRCRAAGRSRRSWRSTRAGCPGPGRRAARPSARRASPRPAAGGSPSTIPRLGADHLAERPVDDARAVRQAAAVADQRRGRGGRCSSSSNWRSSRDLPTPGSPITVARCGPRRRSTRSSRSCSCVSSPARPTSGARRAAGEARGRAGCAAGGQRLPGRHRLGLALQRQRLLQGCELDRLARRAVGAPRRR